MNRNPRKLFIRAQSGDVDARNQLIESNLPLIGAVVNKCGLNSVLKRAGFTDEDIYAVGTLGLIQAIQKFKYTRGRFATYAWAWIRRELMILLQDTSRLVRIPRAIQAHWNRDRAGRPLKTKHRIYLEKYRAHIEREYSDLINVIITDAEPLDTLIEKEKMILLTRALTHLSTRESFIIRAYYAQGRTLADIGQDLNICRERVRQIRVQAVGKLKRLCGVFND